MYVCCVLVCICVFVFLSLEFEITIDFLRTVGVNVYFDGPETVSPKYFIVH